MDGTVVKTIEHQPIQQRTIRHFSSGRREVDGCSVAAGMLRMPVGRMLLKGRRPAVLLASQGHRDWVRPKGPTAARFGCYDTETHQLPFPSFVFFCRCCIFSILLLCFVLSFLFSLLLPISLSWLSVDSPGLEINDCNALWISSGTLWDFRMLWGFARATHRREGHRHSESATSQSLRESIENHRFSAWIIRWRDMRRISDPQRILKDLGVLKNLNQESQESSSVYLHLHPRTRAK